MTLKEKFTENFSSVLLFQTSMTLILQWDTNGKKIYIGYSEAVLVALFDINIFKVP